MHFCCSSYSACVLTDSRVSTLMWRPLCGAGWLQSQDHMRQSCDLWGRCEVKVSMLWEGLAHDGGPWRFPEDMAHELWTGGDTQDGEVGSEVGSRK